MKGQVLKIKFKDSLAFLTTEVALDFKQVYISDRPVRFKAPAFWTIRVLNYIESEKRLFAEVLDYRVGETEFPPNQIQLTDTLIEIEKVGFNKIDTAGLLNTLSSPQHINIPSSQYKPAHREETPTQREKVIESKPIIQTYSEPFPIPIAPTERQPISEIYNVQFTVYFSDAYFMLGYVTFSKTIIELGALVDFKITNDYLLPEFDNIKSWFAKKLKTKKFNVNASITTLDGKVTKVIATSPQIAMINAELVASIKYQRTLALTKSPKISDTDKSLFTAEEIFGEMETEDIEGNVFKQNEQDILSFLLDNHNTRNRKQLEYLSGNKQSEKIKLRFTLHPNFGFLFFIEGKENNHFVWELLNSHATYIWSIEKAEKELELQYKRIEASINTVRDSGREQYKRAYRQNHHDNDLLFCVIEHDSITSKLVDGFVKWKHKLNEKIT